VKLIVYIETGLGGTRAWAITDEPVEDIALVLAPADNVAGEAAALAATEVVEPLVIKAPDNVEPLLEDARNRMALKQEEVD